MKLFSKKEFIEEINSNIRKTPPDIFDFLQDYKKICIKHKKQIIGFDSGAYVIDLTEDEYNLEALVFGGGIDDLDGLHFASSDEFKNSICSVKTYRSSTLSIKEELEEETRKLS